ncbi:hypothetical protein PV356_01425 [Streptomyces sp. WI03-5b]|uniref:hypothetical protein n=1 Tax=Streptomyces sp. WI03-5b TaxID=462946 RepID=UPI0029B5C243|nr:hypothetical protein [Streptomyces sp. WI03-5b]MDX2618184.1 hypothetical protein [Streptomyces sp. WI03-5b]
MSLRPTLRTAVLAAATMGAVLFPSMAAVADSSPTAVPAERPTEPPAASEPSRATSVPEPTDAAESATPAPAEPVPARTVPRGGVDAGERPAGEAGGTALYGSAAGAVLLAGAGVLVMRRRTAAQRDHG